jgi:hypothetical protein
MRAESSMTVFGTCGGLWSRWSCVAFVLLGVTVIANPRSAPANGISEPTGSIGGEAIIVHLDQATLLKVPERTATLVIGNPLIADVTVQTGGIMVVTAKSHGVTNLIALDRAGNVLTAHPIQVIGAVNSVVLYRGIERESYSCQPICERRIALGDSVNYFNANLTQGSTLNIQAQGGASQR